MESPNASGRRPTVREILASQFIQEGGGKAGMSEKDVADILAPLGGLEGGVLFAGMKIGESVGKGLGLKSAKSLERVFPYPYPKVVLALFLALKHLEREVAAAYDTKTGCAIEAKLPVDWFSLGGQLTFDVTDEEAAGTRVAAASEVRGQLFDWGKGKRALAEILDQADGYLRRLL